MKKRLGFIIGIILLLNINLIFAHEHDFDETKQLIDSGTNCDKLTEEQLEAMGDYYMEQMHPGEAHELMDQMMGGEGSESLRRVHINMARRLYCNENRGGMTGMMGGGMMNMMAGNNFMGSGMMGTGGYGFGYGSFVSILYLILLIGLIILVYLWIIKLWKNIEHKGRKK